MSTVNDNTPALSPVKQALLEVRRLNQRIEELESRSQEPVAITGAGLRFPGEVNDLNALWALLSNGDNAVSQVPSDRWHPGVPASLELDESAQSAMGFGGFLKDIKGFDAHFFGISPREAEAMDPQQRILLEVCWDALENANTPPDRLMDRSCGVFLGICGSDYYRMLLSDPGAGDHYTTTGSALSVAAGRISYLLGLHGPNLAVDTACSSSLVALHLAVRSLRSGECDLALVGGVNLILTPEVTQNFAMAHMLAPDGRCKTFDARADGYVRSEGCAVVVLKRLSAAQADGDRILGLIRGTAINHDGRSGGLTAPNGPAQEAVIAAALADAGLPAASVGYVEAHGTGTSLGDPIEAGALVNALCQGREQDSPLRVGSVKTNLGHMEAAAGLAGLLKAVLVLQRRQIPPHLNLEQLNPHLHLEQVPLEIPTRLTPWQDGAPLIAGVSSFGLSGTNAHILLEAAPPVSAAAGALSSPAGRTILSLSARSLPALQALASRWENFLEQLPEERFEAACRTAGTGRAHYDHRLALAVGSPAEGREMLAHFTAGKPYPGMYLGSRQPGRTPAVAFLFSGHGSNYAGMGRRLYETQPVFRDTMDECAERLASILEKPLLAALYPDHHPAGDPSLLDRMDFAQAALFSLQLSLARTWVSWGVQPSYLLGHSAGEYPAAVLAGVMSLEDGLRLVAARSSLMVENMDEGRMAVVFAGAQIVAAAIAPYHDRLSIAAYNGPKTVVVSGECQALNLALENLSRQGIKSRPLAIGQAAHSPLIEPSLDAFSRQAAAVHFAPARLGFVSTVLGRIAEAEEVASADYWRRHLRQPVRFMEAMAALHAQGAEIFIEIGPNPVLLALGERCLPRSTPAAWLPSLRQGRDDWEPMLESLAEAYTRGLDPQWENLGGSSGHGEAVPTYPFQREPYWAISTGAAWKNEAAPSNAKPDASPITRQVNSSQTWQAIVSAGDRQAAQVPVDLSLGAYPAIWSHLDRLTSAYILHALRSLALFSKPGEWYSFEEITARAGIEPVYQRLLANWLDKLTAEGCLQQRDDSYRAENLLPVPRIDQVTVQAHSALQDLPFLEAYVLRCGKQLVDILTGKANPLDTLFPGGSFDLAEDLYGHWALSRYFANLIQALVAAYGKFCLPERPVRILEIGAGTGGTAQAVLPALDPDSSQYTFTDVSDLFLNRASEKFAGYSFVRYACLDIERSPGEQGFPAQSYDIVIAANVLHATHDLRQTLNHVRSLLAPGGLLLATEATTYLSWFDITTGLIAGWQRFTDGLRTTTPLLPAPRWIELLGEAGFENISTWPESSSPASILGQSILAAQLPTDSLPAASTGRVEAAAFLSPAGSLTPEPAEPVDFVHHLGEALPAEREELLLDLLRGELRRILRLSPTFSLGPDIPLMDLGLDSLMSLELRRSLSIRLSLPEDDLPSTLAFDYPSPARLAAFLAGFFTRPDYGPAAPADDISSPVQSEIADLSDEEVAALLIARLTKSKTD